MNKIDLAEKNLDKISKWISHADQKVGIAFVFQAGLVGFLTTSKAEDIKTILVHGCSIFPLLLFLSLVLFFLFIGKAAYHSLKVLYPDVTTRERSFFFFGSIFGMGLKEFKKGFSKLKDEDIIDDLNNQIFITSEIATAKFSNVKSSIVYTGWATVFWIISLLLIAFLKPDDNPIIYYILK